MSDNPIIVQVSSFAQAIASFGAPAAAEIGPTAAAADPLASLTLSVAARE